MSKKITPSNNKKTKRKVSARFLWLVSLLAAICFMTVFCLTPLFPLKWKLIVLAGMIVLLGLTFLLSIKTSPKNLFTKIVNIFLCIVLFVASIIIPYEVDKISSLFDKVAGQKIVINVYRMSDSYISSSNFTDAFKYNSNDDGTVTDISDLKEAKFITSVAGDQENTEYALVQLNSEFASTPKTIDRESFVDAAASLYEGEADFLIMPSTYENVLKDTNRFTNFSKETTVVYSFTRSIKTTAVVKGDTTLTKQPFNIFFGGNDEEGDLSLEGHTDVCMLVTVNPNTHQVAIVNMPRDSYVPNPYYNGANDKLTHLGLKGITNTLDGLGSYLEEKINNYVIINFTTFQTIINVLDGVDVENPYAFDADDGETFEEGTIHLTGNSALMYVRERHHLPDGDFGRSMHQQLVMSAIIDKITSAEGIVRFNSILDSISGQFLTNISSKAIYGLVNKQLNEKMSWNIVKYHVVGDSGMEECASAPGEDLSVVYPYTNQVAFVKSVIDDVDNGEYVEQQDIPDGSYKTTN